MDKSDTQVQRMGKIGTRPKCYSCLQEMHWTCNQVLARCSYHTSIPYNIIDQWWPDELDGAHDHQYFKQFEWSDSHQMPIKEGERRKKTEGRSQKQVAGEEEESVGEECFSVQPPINVDPRNPFLSCLISIPSRVPRSLVRTTKVAESLPKLDDVQSSFLSCSLVKMSVPVHAIVNLCGG
jgi:hypothetical protein